MKNRISELRENLHQAIDSKDRNEILRISRELDELIKEYYEEEKSIKKHRD